MTLGTALIVAMLGAAALLAVRTQRRQTDLSGDILQANLNAQTGLEMALFRINENTNWRTMLTDGTWELSAIALTGTYSFVGIDPDDGDLSNDSLDPVLITATGTCGSANQKVALRLKIRKTGLPCLEPIIHSNGNLLFDSTTVNGDRLVSSNARVSAATASQVYVEAQSKLTPTATDGSVFHAGTTTDGTWPRVMPVAAQALEYYLTNGTTIDAADLPREGAEQLSNSDMSEATAGWEAMDRCTLTLDAEASQTPWSILVDGRSGPGDGPSQVVTEKIQNGVTCALTADAKSLSSPTNLRISLRVTSSDSGTQTFSTEWSEVKKNQFSTITGNVTPAWTGTLVEARWFVESETDSNGFWFDDAGLSEASPQAGFLAIHRTVLSPASNPFGSGATNAQGIYVIQCDGNPISIKNSRIVGTLVLVDFDDTQSLVHGSMSWEPSVESPDPAVTNLPILLADGSLQFDTSAAGLDEALLNVNLNPAGTPYEGAADSEMDDVVPSLLDGMIYVNGDVGVTSSLRLHGALVSSAIATFTGADVIANYNPVYFWYNAPPGFEGEPAVEVVPGSYRRVVD